MMLGNSPPSVRREQYLLLEGGLASTPYSFDANLSFVLTEAKQGGGLRYSARRKPSKP